VSASNSVYGVCAFDRAQDERARDCFFASEIENVDNDVPTNAPLFELMSGGGGNTLQLAATVVRNLKLKGLKARQMIAQQAK
jgi:hypothetical protein